jgi:hypothetical protein
VFIINIIFAHAQPRFERIKVIRPADSSGAGVAGVFMDRYNHIYIAGAFSNSIQFDSIQFTTRLNFSEPFIAKYDSNFNLIWATSPAGPRGAWDMALDASANTYITGWYENLPGNVCSMCLRQHGGLFRLSRRRTRCARRTSADATCRDFASRADHPS